MSDQERMAEAMAANSVGEVHTPLTAESLAILLADLLGVWVGRNGDMAEFYEAIGKAVARLHEEASAAKFRDALRATAPSDNVRDGLNRILGAIGADNVDTAIQALRNEGEQRRQMHQAIGSMQRQIEVEKNVAAKWKNDFLKADAATYEATQDRDCALEDLAALVDIYARTQR